MNVALDRDELVRRLALVARAAAPRSTVQVLGAVLLEARDGELALAATDLELSIRTVADADVSADGVAAVPARTLLDLVRLLPPGRVTLGRADGAVRVATADADYDLRTIDAADFPGLPAIPETVAVDAGAFLETVGRVARAASRDRSRPVFTGILTRLERGRLVMVAADGYRLALKETPVAWSGDETEAIVPARALAEVGQVVAGGEELRAAVGRDHVFFGAAHTWLTTRRIDGRFHDYASLLGTPFAREASTDRAALVAAVGRAAVLAERASPVELAFGAGEVTVRMRTAERGEARETLPAEHADEPISVAFNPAYLRDGLESVAGPRVRFRINDPLRPVVLCGADDDFAYLVAPILRPAS